LFVLAVERLQFAHLSLVLGLPHFHPDLPRLDVRDVVHDVQLQVELTAGGRRRGAAAAAGRVSAVGPRPLARVRGDRFPSVPAEQRHGRLGYRDDGMSASGRVWSRSPGQRGQERFFPGRRAGRTLVAQSPHLRCANKRKTTIFFHRVVPNTPPSVLLLSNCIAT